MPTFLTRKQSWGVVAAVAVLAAAFGLGVFVGRRGSDGGGEHAHDGRGPAPVEAAVQTWTCSMHPQIKQPDPGLCPICAMDLIPLAGDGGDDLGPRELKLSASARKLARVQVEPAARLPVHREVRMVGTVDYDETRLATISAWVGGRLDRLYVDYTGIAVKEGDHMVWMYSPDVLAAQEELIQARKAVAEIGGAQGNVARVTAEATLAATRDKLRLWGLTAAQIEEIEVRGSASDHIQINAPTGGIVVHKNAVEGVYVKTGTPIYQIADLTRVWVRLDAYESDLPWLRYGQDVTFTTEGQPGRTFSGRIAFIDPLLTNRTRTVKVRVNVSNADGALKPGMFVRATVRARVTAAGNVVAPDLAGKWISPMHPEVVKDGPGTCDVCGMPLVKAEELGFVAPGAPSQAPLVIPVSAPLITGRRAVVYVQDPEDESRFAGREIVLGPRTEAHYVVDSGLEEGELVVVNGNFKIDSALQVVAKPSMMTPAGGGVAASHHNGSDTPTAAPMADEPERVKAPSGFIEQLGAVFGRYLQTQEALAADDLGTAREAAAALVRELAGVDMAALDGQAHTAWMKSRDDLRAASGRLRNGRDLETARQAFEALSRVSIRTAKLFGTSPEGELHVVHCPMAFENTGADWLQREPTVANPYFGAAMLRCGEVTASISPAQADPQPSARGDGGQAYKDLPRAFSEQLAAVLDAYLETHRALSQDNAEGAKATASNVLTRLAEVDMALLAHEPHMAWVPVLAELRKAAGLVAQGRDISASREGFSALSESLTAALRRFGTGIRRPVVQLRCPMAFNDRGASWLQDHAEVENPYFGATMFRCGEVIDTLISVGAEQKEGEHHE